MNYLPPCNDHEHQSLPPHPRHRRRKRLVRVSTFELLTNPRIAGKVLATWAKSRYENFCYLNNYRRGCGYLSLQDPDPTATSPGC